jgi:hypothetical protein
MKLLRDIEWIQKTPADNGRFRASGGVAPQKRQCDFGSFAPARAVVNPRLREAASTLAASGRHRRQTNKKDNETRKKRNENAASPQNPYRFAATFFLSFIFYFRFLFRQFL